MTEIGVYRVEVDQIPELGVVVTIAVKIKEWGNVYWTVKKEWTVAFYPEERNTLPIERSIRLSLLVTENDFNFSAVPVRAGAGAFRIDYDAKVILEGGKTESLIGGGGSEFGIEIISEHPVIASFSRNLLGIGIGMFLVGVLMIIGILTRKRWDLRVQKSVEIA